VTDADAEALAREREVPVAEALASAPASVEVSVEVELEWSAWAIVPLVASSVPIPQPTTSPSAVVSSFSGVEDVPSASVIVKRVVQSLSV
jgi:hypothetical protein